MLIKQSVNALGLICPAPLLMTRVALNSIAIGECVEVFCSDASSVEDFHQLIKLTQHKMMAFEVVNQCLVISADNADQNNADQNNADQKNVNQVSICRNNADQVNMNQDVAKQYRYVLKKGQ